METSDFFRCRIDAMINLSDPLAVLATRLPWNEIEAALAPMFAHKDRAGQANDDVDLFGPSLAVAGAGRSNAGRPRLPIRLMTSLLYLKHSFNLSDEELCQRWSENVLWQFFSGMDYYEHRQPCDATQIGRFRRDLGEEGLEQLLKATIDAAVAMKAVKPQALERVIVDTTVQEKAIAHPVDSRLLEKSPPQGGQRRQARRDQVQADIRQSRQGAAPQGRRLRPCQTVSPPEENRQAPTHDPGHRDARGAAQARSSGLCSVQREGVERSDDVARTRRAHPHAATP